MSNAKPEQKEEVPKEEKIRDASSGLRDGDENRNEGSKNGQSPERQKSREKTIIKAGVTGTVKWYNFIRRYGFISRNDEKEDIFVHQTAIAKFSPEKLVASLGDGEEVLFDVVEGGNGPEAANVTGSNGEPVRGSKHCRDKQSDGNFRRGTFRRGGPRGGRRGRGGGMRTDSEGRGEAGPPPNQRPRGRGRGRGRDWNQPIYRNPQSSDEHDSSRNEEGRYLSSDGGPRGPPRRGGGFRGRGRGRGRGGPRPYNQ